MPTMELKDLDQTSET